MRQRACSGFARVGQHQDCSFLELRLGSGVTKVGFVHLLTIRRLLFGLAEKEMQRARAMMLWNKIGDPVWQTNLFRESQSIGNVAGDYLGALCRAQAIVGIASSLVLNKVIRRRHLADVVIQRSDARHQGIGADSPPSVFANLADPLRASLGAL